MNRFLKRILGDRLKIDWKIAVVTIMSTLLIMVDYYYSPTSKNYYDSILLYAAIPLLITILIFRENPKSLGFTFGDWKTGLLLTFLGLIIMAPIIWYLGVKNPGMMNYYARSQEGLIWKKALEIFGWDICFGDGSYSVMPKNTVLTLSGSRQCHLRLLILVNQILKHYPQSLEDLHLVGLPGEQVHFSIHS